MTPSWRTVCFGLRLILIGAQTIGWSLAAIFTLGCGGSALLIATKWHDAAGWVVLTLLFTAIGIGVLGRLLCAVGRWFCMVTPPEATKARTRIRLTVILEMCGLLSGGLALGLITFGVRLPLEFTTLGAGFWLLTTVLGRVCFYPFALAVSEDTGARATDDARLFFRLSLFALGAVILGPTLMAFGNLVVGDDTAILIVRCVLCVSGGVLLFAAAGIALYLFVGHFILINDLRRHLASYTPKPLKNDPDREYLERHLVSGGSADDT